MLISRVSDGDGQRVGQNADEYQTADELFELMAKDHSYSTSNNQSLSARDLIILYKNIDVGTKLMSNANVQKQKRPNQHVETVVYKDERDSDDSDLSEIYSNEDLHDLITINNERIDLINNLSSIQHPLCPKFGDIEIQPPNLTPEYDNSFLFKDPYIKQQLKNINILADSTGFDTMLPASLLEYICSKRLEDNYSFYMDNIIRYVQHTIDQLKRISNGDYLTEKARAKWREVANDLVVPNSDATKILATSVSIPIHVMRKANGHRSTWDDIVHSEVDVRSLSKILEKKIIIEVPRLICGSYKLFSNCFADNLIISYTQDLNRNIEQNKRESRMNVVFQLKPSGSGHVISNINSIMILQKEPSLTTQDANGDQHKEIGFRNYNVSVEDQPKIVEIDEQNEKDEIKPMEIKEWTIMNIDINKSITDTKDYSLPNKNFISSNPRSIDDKENISKISMKTLKTEIDITLMSPDELRCAIQRLNMQTPVPEESDESFMNKKKSTTKVRIKSPYENKSFSIEEKKRKKLLEIREKREKKKMALSENCRITKHKYGKGAVMAQSSSSVTKLSITNKSFYNSIYGESGNTEDGAAKKSRKSQINEVPIKLDCENKYLKSSLTSFDQNSLDDGTPETVMQIHQKLDIETYPISISAISNCNTEVNLLSQLIGSSGTYCSSDDDSSQVQEIKDDDMQEIHEGSSDVEELIDYQSSCNIVPANTPKERDPLDKSQDEIQKITTPVECRKSIDKIYDLLKKLGKHTDNERSNMDDTVIDGHHSSTMQISDSGTSVKHHVVSTNPSTFSFGKNSNLSKQTTKDKKKREVPTTVAPKVTISSKLQTTKVDADRKKTDRQRFVTSPSSKASDNPLKAISELLHEFNNVQKTRLKSHKKADNIHGDGKTVSRQGSSKKPRQEQSNKDTVAATLKSPSYKDRRSRTGQPTDPVQLSHQITYVDDKNASRIARKNISDIIDEVKEARGEAVRGPSRPYSRLNTLAQPKKSYVQAHNEEYQNKYGRNITANRLQRVTTSVPLVEKNAININHTRNKRKGLETTSVSSTKPGISALPPLERIIRTRRSASNSPERKPVPQTAIELPFKQTTAPKSPDLKKKMVAVESYVKSHYGHMPIDTSELKCHEVHKSRVPLIPNDIELASLNSSPTLEESTALGNQLHYMVDTMINTHAPALSVLTEYRESSSKLSDGLEKLSSDSLSKVGEPKSESDYLVDIFKDKTILTAVASIPKDKIQEDKVVDENVDTYDVQPFNSATELRKLENALYQQMSVGAFPKRLRIKNLTLTPKQSLQQVIVVQSGDAGSLLVKSNLSHNLKNESKSDSLTAYKPMAVLSNTHVNWGFTNIPLQVATIGYAFPTFNSTQRDMLSPCIQTLIENLSNADVSKDASRSHKTSQCFKGTHTESCLEKATQANKVISVPSTSKIHTEILEEQKEELKKEHEITLHFEKTQPCTKKIIREEPKTETLEPQTNNELNMKTGGRENLKIMTPTCETITVVENCEGAPDIVGKRNENQDTTPSKMFINSLDIDIHEARREPSESIDHSTSLDILIGLLNEIQKITGEAANENINNKHETNSHCKELEIILNNAANQECSIDNNCRDLVSLSSFDKINQIDSSPSICSSNILKDGNIVVNNENIKVIEIVKDTLVDFSSKNIDKEVTVDIEKQYMNKLTNAPSCSIPLTINHSTNITESIIDILDEPSTPSVYSIAKNETLYNDLSFDDEIKLSVEESTKVMETIDDIIEPEDFSIYNNQKDIKIQREQTAKVKVKATAVVCSNYESASKAITGTHVTMSSDPLMKIKRDILVTVYSILVFTVFAALSFPKVFFYVEM